MSDDIVEGVFLKDITGQRDFDNTFNERSPKITYILTSATQVEHVYIFTAYGLQLSAVYPVHMQCFFNCNNLVLPAFQIFTFIIDSKVSLPRWGTLCWF